MKDEIISLRVDKNLKSRMKTHNEIKWGVILRNAIVETLENQSREEIEKRKKAVGMMDRIRKSGVFDGGKNSTQIIREWRDKRR